MKRTFLKVAFYAVVALGVMAALAPYIPAAFLRGRVEAALARSLNRPVQIGDIRFTFFPNGPVPGPGFALEEVTIHEDSRVGIEPFAYMTELGASVRVLSLLAGRLELSGINLGNASVNLVKTQAGMWNFHYLLDNLKAENVPLPALRMRGGRVNFKFDDTKAVFFFNDADIDVTPSASGGMDLRFSGEPSRSDHTKQDFGRFFIRGTSSASNRLNLSVELQRSSLEEMLRLIDPQGFGVHGILALTGRLEGDPSALKLTGNVEIGDIHRSDLLPEEGQAWRLPIEGSLDLRSERFDIASAEVNPVVGLQFHAESYLSNPRWRAAAEFREMPLAVLFRVARHMGATLPADLDVSGTVSGSAAYGDQDGLTGKLTAQDAAFLQPGSEPLKAAAATLEIRGGAVQLAPATIVVSPLQTAQMEGKVGIASPHPLDLRITTRGLKIAAMRSFGLPELPVVGAHPQASWSGWARYQNGKWSSEAEVRDAKVQVDGMAVPVEIASANLSITPARLAISKIVGKAGEIEFGGSYEIRGAQPARFAFSVPELSVAELDRILAPTLARAGPGFFERTLRLRTPAPAPAWLKARHAEGTLTIGTASAADWRATDIRTRVLWDGAQVHFTETTAEIGAAEFAGILDLDLTTPSTAYRLEGTLRGVPYHGGTLDLNGTVEAEGSSAQLWESARAQGSVRGRGIAFATDAEFRTVAADFEMQAVGTTPRWKLSAVEAMVGMTLLAGTGASQEDGQLVLTLMQGERSVRYAGTLFAARPTTK